jgi:hypothetical protein
MLTKMAVLVIFVAIVIALGSSLVYLVKDKGGDSNRMVKALTFRVGLSLSLFILLMILGATDVIHLHGVYPQGPTQ